MKKNFMVAISVLLIFTCFAGCGKEKRALYNFDLADYIEIPEYKGIEVDTNSDAYKENYQQEINGDVSNNSLYNETEIKSGKVQNGDVVDINYSGKKDGVQFEGGTAENQELEIGSNSFIDGFEEGLIGVEVGDTVDLNLKFPENYGNEELNGAEVVFTVKVNSIKKRPLTPEEYYKELNFKTLKAYEMDLKKRAVTSTIISMLDEDTKVNKYSDADLEVLFDGVKKQIESAATSYSMTAEEYIEAAYGMSFDEFKEEYIEATLKPAAKIQMLIYAIFDKEKMTCTEDEKNLKINEIIEQYSTTSQITAEQVKEAYGDYGIEYTVVEEKVFDFLYENAIVK